MTYDFVQQRSAQAGSHARRHNKLQPDPVLSLPCGSSLDGYLQIRILSPLAIQTEYEGDGLVGGKTLLGQKVDAGDADVFDAPWPRSRVDAVKSRKARCGPSLGARLLRFAEPL